jgi:asparagine synthase (glutamine-hydrolysing)
MCGIAGIVYLNGEKVEESRLRSMADSIKHRGPDGEGFWLNITEEVGLAHRRLSILDLSSAAKQPMHYEGQYTITFNGEIYNYVEIKERLVAKGYTFFSDSDTEVLVALYSLKAERCLEELDGMFAFAIWDHKEQKLFCARDRFGEKPFYYHYLPGTHFVFASEIKALITAGVKKRIDQHMLFNYLAYDVIEDSVNKQKTFFEEIEKLEAGHYMVINKEKGVDKKRYWKIPDPSQINTQISFESANEELKSLFERSVKRRLRSDVPVGTSLSGGLDSSSIVCTIAKIIQGSPQVLQTFSARFNSAQDEGVHIDKVIEKTKASPHYIWPDADNLVKDINLLFYHQEEPFHTASIFAQWEVMKLAKDNKVVVLLDGQGADEVFAGYDHYIYYFLRELYVKNRKEFEIEMKEFENLYQYKYPIDIRFKLDSYFPSLLKFV